MAFDYALLEFCIITMIPKIRSTVKSDESGLISLNNESTPAVNLLTPDLFAHLTAQAKYCLTLILDKELIGFLLALPPGILYSSENYRWFSSRYDKFLYIDRIVIKKSHRRCGFGSMLYDRLLMLNSNEYPRLTCEVNIAPINERSLEFHGSYGFQEIGTQETENGSKHVMLMEHKLR